MPSIFSYYGDINPEYGQRTRRTIDNGGYTGDHTIAFGANISNILYVEPDSVFRPCNIPDTIFTAKRILITLSQTWSTLTTQTILMHPEQDGILKQGIIVRPIESLRLGFSFATPTVYKIDEVFYSNLSAFLDNDTPGDSSDDADPLVEQVR
ncbi:MAG: hypothetical protein MZV64_18640 [Ignavibacteriales bacterium]|nr:hypothetical protein [Ignavibacteriales bacterium]